MRQRYVWAWLVVVCLACGCAKQEAAWVPFSSSEGRFSALMPGVPEQKSEAQAGEIPSYGFQIINKDVRLLLRVSYSDLPAPPARETREMLRELIQKQMVGPDSRVVEQHDITLGPHSGVEVELSIHPRQVQLEVITRKRLFLVGQRLYQVTATTPANQAKPEDVKKFFDSFQITS